MQKMEEMFEEKLKKIQKKNKSKFIHAVGHHLEEEEKPSRQPMLDTSSLV
jgi:GTP-dependent phosphoenolpyruvate carboxykinase